MIRAWRLAAGLGLALALAPLAAEDSTRPEQLNVYLMGAEPADIGSVTAEFNRLARRDLNATVKWTFLGWDKWDQKYNLALASGEPISLIYTANWANYQSYARKGAFLPLNDLLPRAAPGLCASISEPQRREAEIGGKLYTVPNDWKEYQTNCIVYRADLAEKLGFRGPLTSLDAVERFLKAAKAAAPESFPYSATYDDLMQIQDAFLGRYDKLIRGTFLGYQVVRDTDGRLVDWVQTPEFENYVRTMKRWHDLGFWPRDILSNRVTSEEAFKQGRNAAASGNPTKADALYRSVAEANPSWKLGAFVYALAQGRAYSNPSIGNGMALPRSSPNAERALRLLEKLRTDPDYYRLTTYGVLGRHYRLDDQGRVVSIPDRGFWYQSMQPWGWHVDRMELPAAGAWPEYAGINAALDKVARNNPLSTFAFDEAPVAAQISALRQVANQVLIPLYTGAAADVGAAVRDLKLRLKAAGSDEFRAEMSRQITQFLSGSR